MVSFEAYKQYLKSFCEKYDWPKEALTAHEEALDKLRGNEKYFGFIDDYFNDKPQNIYDIVTELQELLKDEAVQSETAELLYFILCSARLKGRYAEKGLSEELFDGVIADLKYKLNECYKLKGIWGTFVAHWFYRFFEMTRFAIGRLQYEMSTMPEIFDDNVNKIYGGEKAVNIHIPSAGPLLIEDCEKSLKEATKFFADEFEGDTVLFRCSSWLLFPENRKILPETSRILKFMDLFEIFDSGYYEGEKNDVMWRIFGTEEKDLSKLPQDTSMQRGYIAWLKAGNKLGFGKGIIKRKK